MLFGLKLNEALNLGPWSWCVPGHGERRQSFSPVVICEAEAVAGIIRLTGQGRRR